jgi:hypothetical protein
MTKPQDDTGNRLADDLFLIAHDDYTGKPHPASNTFSAALAGAVLAELAFDGRIAIDHSQVYVADKRSRQEPLTDRALGEIVHRGDGHPVRTWLDFLSTRVRDRVGERLVNAGLVYRTTSRGLSLRSSVRWPGVDPNIVAVPRVRLAAVLERGEEPLDMRTATLAALVAAAGMLRVLNLENKAAVGKITAARRMLPSALAELLAAVDAVISTPALLRR